MLDRGRRVRSVFDKILFAFALLAGVILLGCTPTPPPPAAPQISSAAATAFVVGANGTFTVTATGNPVPTLSEMGALPNNVMFNAATGVLSGTPQAGTAGNYPIVFTAQNGNPPNATQNFTLTVNQAPAITTQPTNTTVNATQNASFTAAASGTPAPTVQWQVSTNGGASFSNVPGATSATLNLTAVTAAMNGNEYQAVFTNAAGSVTSQAATLTVDFAPSITTQPTNQTALVGANASFNAAANANPAATVQWQVSTNAGVTFNNIPGATSTTLTLNAVTLVMGGNQYQAVFTNTVSSTTTTAATLTVNQAPAITTQPVNTTVNATQNASFTAAASGSPAPTVQWQVSTNGGTSFSNVPGATSATLNLLAVTAGMNGNEYKAVFTNVAGSVTSQAATLTVDFAPAITTQPTNQTALVGNNATFTAAANANPAATVTWLQSSNGGVTFIAIAGNSTTLTLNAVTLSMNGYQYEAVFTNTVSSTTTTAATLTVNQGPAITTQPTNTTVNATQNTNFTAAASGSPAPTVQWQVSTNGGTSFSNINGATSGTLNLLAVTAAMNGNQYQAVFTNVAGSVTSQAATLTVDFAPTVTTQPTNQTVGAGGNASFTAAANANPAATVQWQVSTNAGVTFNNIPGATSTTLTLNAVTLAMSGNLYQAVFTNIVSSATTNAATLTVNQSPGITTQPTNTTVNAGQNASFTAAASGNPVPTVQWQVSTNGGTSFSNINGATSGTLNLLAVTAAMNGNQYQAVFTNTGGSATTQAATLTVDFAPTITTQPTNQTIGAGGNASFTAAASANPAATVQWQVSTDNGVTFNNVPGATSTTLTLNAVTLAMSGNQYEAVFTNTVSSATTNAATLTVNQAPVITLQPTNQSISSGNNATFTATASGNPAPTVQWQVSTDGGVTFTNITGATSTTLNVNSATVLQNGYQYQAKFTNTNGSQTTNAVTLTVTGPPLITQNPSNTTVQVGSNANFSASAAGNPAPTVQWQVSTNGGTSFSNIGGATSTSLTVTSVTSPMSGNQYQAVFTNINGSQTTSAATLTVTTSLPATCTGAPSGSESLVTGHWAALVQGWQGSNAGSPVAMAFALDTDGAGNFVNLGTGASGDLDQQLGASGASSYQHLIIEQAGSSYVIGLDPTSSAGYVGCMTLATSASTTIHFRFTLGGINGGHASKGRIIEWDDTTGSGVRVGGVMMPQDSTKFTLSSVASDYAFGEDGVDINGGHFAVAGSATITSSGVVTTEVDFNDAGTGGGPFPGSGTVSGISALTGRGSLASTMTVGGVVQPTAHDILYVVNANEYFTVSADAFGSSSPIVSGRGIVTGHGNFAAISGNFMAHITGIAANGCNTSGSSFNCADVNLVAIGASVTGAQTSSITGVSWEYRQGNTVSLNPLSSITATVDSTWGRMAISGAGAQQAPVFYLATPQSNTEPYVAFAAGSGTTGNLDPNAGFGFVEAGASTDLTTAALAGNYFFGGEDSGDSSVQMQAGVVTVASSGAATGTQDQDSNGNGNGLQTKGLGGGLITVTNNDTNTPIDHFPGIANVGSGTYGITNGTRFIFFDTGSSSGAGNSSAGFTILDKQ